MGNERQLAIIHWVLIVSIFMLSLACVLLTITKAYIPLTICAGAVVLLVAVVMMWFSRPDYQQAEGTTVTLEAAGETLTFMREGLSDHSALQACNIILSATEAEVVGIVQEGRVLASAGLKDPEMEDLLALIGLVEDAVERRQLFLVLDSSSIPAPLVKSKLGAGIVSPLIVNENVVGAVVFLYRATRYINGNQIALARGLCTFISTQLSLAELDAQTELATRMELKALQAQINPHFLFNTINTIASLIRTDPMKARELLREFAVFYRRTLENSEDLITIDQELEQTNRYLMFERARFGEDRIITNVQVEEGLNDILVPAFVVQPLVENAVQHAMRDDAPLQVDINVITREGRVVIQVIDDGVGMSPDRIPVALQTEGSSGMGIALKNVDDRLRGYFGKNAGLDIQSELGVGTTVTLLLGRARSMQLA